ncbi:MAG: hypothetical protein ACI9HK_003978 [Pirellulaceae bacterium]|jgi:hypothetical protein
MIMEYAVRLPIILRTKNMLRIKTPRVVAIGICSLAVALSLDIPILAEAFTLEQPTYSAKDTLSVGEESDADAKACLTGLTWPAKDFQVGWLAAEEGKGDVVVHFPSPRPSGDEVNDRVTMEWYVARDNDGKPIKAPAVVVVHESGSGMTVGRLFAQGLRTKRLHALLIHLPYYGHRKGNKKRPVGQSIFKVMQQSVADVRRARDAVAALPLIDNKRIALQGTSLGGFVSATAAGIDQCYQEVFILLAGGELHEVIRNGAREAAEIRKELERAGITDDKLEQLIRVVEPTRIAHRLDPNHTWLYSGKFDKVVPMKSAYALANAAKLEKTHHIQMLANHYSGIVYMPLILSHISNEVLGLKSGKPGDSKIDNQTEGGTSQSVQEENPTIEEQPDTQEKTPRANEKTRVN